MPKIVVVVQEVVQKTRMISLIRDATGFSPSAITESLAGRKALGEWPLFGNDHDEVAQCLRSLLKIPQTEGALGFYELQNNESFDKNTSENLMISIETLQNILDTHDVQRRNFDEGR